VIMIDTPYVTQSQEQLTALVHLTVPRNEIQRAMGPGLIEVKVAIAGQGIKAIGPWFTHHRRVDPEVFDFEICLPVAKEVTATGRVRPGRMAARKVVRTIYRGPYQGLGAAWGEFGNWIAKRGYRTEDDLWECYLAGLEKSADPAEWETELNRAIE
jgi:effector-binding domain-containing protein